MNITERVRGYLRQREPNPICDGCIARDMQLTRKQVQRAIYKLRRTTDEIKRDKYLCLLCPLHDGGNGEQTATKFSK